MPADVKEVFLAAAALPEADRSGYLDKACGEDAALRQRVEALLRAHDAPSDSPVKHDMTADYQPLADPGMVIAGRYTLVERIGEGGMGEVWVAKQTEPVKRKVALKLIKAGMDSKAVQQRFEQERQALALMDHPNIARVIDGGTTGAGRPYFVMELVNGLPLNKFCDEAKLGVRDRLELFTSICQAVQHAHQKGIIHRDLKPSNILVTIIDGKPIPKVIDFGVAKAISGRLTDESLSTQLGAVVGTLEYMSPEQAGFAGEDIDTRSDIYSLGVILYELLTGLRPIDGQRLRMAALTEMIRIIKEEEPSKPSTRLSTNESAPSLAALRHTEPKKLMAMLRGELDWVVMKCLEKRRDRRYETANGLARDIQRYLANEMVEARPQSAGYRMQKFVSRYRSQVIAAGLVLLALLAGIAGTTYGLIRAENRRAEAERARTETQNERIRADENFREALRAVDEYYTKIAQNQLIDFRLPGIQPLRKELLETALRYYQHFAEKHADDPTVRLELAKAFGRMGFITAQTGTQEEGLRLLLKSRDLLQVLAGERPNDADIRIPLAETYTKLAGLQVDILRTAEALESARKSVSLHRELLSAASADAERREELAAACCILGDILAKTNLAAEAIDADRESIDLYQQLMRDHPTETKYVISLAGMHHNIGMVYQDSLGKGQEAVAAFSQALALEEQVAAKVPYDVRVQDYTIRHLYCLGVAYDDSFKQPDRALAYFKRAAALREKTVRENPSVHDFRGHLSSIYRQIGRLQRMLGARELAAEAFDKAFQLLETLVAEQPTNSEYWRTLALTCTSLAHLLRESGEASEATRYYRQAVEVEEKLARDDPAFSLNHWYSVIFLSNLGLHYSLLDMVEDARQTVVRITPILTELERRGFKDRSYSSDSVRRYQSQITSVNAQVAKTEKALRTLEESVANEQAQLPADSPTVEARTKLIGLHNDCALRLWRLGRKEQALVHSQDALRLLEALVKERPDDLTNHSTRMSSLAFSARVYRDLGRPAKALQAARAALDAWNPRLAESPDRLTDLASTRALGSALIGEQRATLTEAETAERRRLEDLAIQAIREAIVKGLQDARPLKSNVDLDSLRRRDDFKKLIAELEKGAAATTP
jgi:eukaryotic-like serine/threonine-protein kinase